jgi:hypothetical protein
MTLAEAAAAARATLLLTTKLLTSAGCNGYIKKVQVQVQVQVQKNQGPGNNRRCCINVVALMMSVDDV